MHTLKPTKDVLLSSTKQADTTPFYSLLVNINTKWAQCRNFNHKTVVTTWESRVCALAICDEPVQKYCLWHKFQPCKSWLNAKLTKNWWHQVVAKTFRVGWQKVFFVDGWTNYTCFSNTNVLFHKCAFKYFLINVFLICLFNQAAVHCQVWSPQCIRP